MEESGQRRAWSNIRRGVFTPEPLDDMDEHWIEVTESSELMCDNCKSFQPGDIRMNNNTELLLGLRQQLDHNWNVCD